jgi:nicotinic acetylcholine receptor, invertebrate
VFKSQQEAADIESMEQKENSWKLFKEYALIYSVFMNIQVDLKHARSESAGLGDYDIIEYGIDLKDFYRSVEWDLLAVPARKNEKFYTCCSEPYPDITFNITIRRKTLFHTVNLIIPCVAITFLTVIVFHLPSDR